MSTVKLSVDNQVATLFIDRAEKHNALNQAMWQQISDYCDQLQNEIKPRVLLIKAAGDKAFCAGADIAELTEIIEDESRLKTNNEIVQQAQLKLQQLPCATIAVINGVCVGGGLGLALSCDFRIAVQSAQFAITPAKLGLLYSIEDTRRLVNIIGLSRAKELLYLGKRVDGQTALDWGLINELVSSQGLAVCVDDWVKSLLSVSGNSISGIKQTLGYLIDPESTDKCHVEQLFDCAFTHPDFIEGAQAFLAKRPAKFN